MNKYTFLLPILLLALLFQGCIQDKCTSVNTYVRNTPIYMGYEEVKASVASEEPREIENPGKIYFKDDHLFINEINEGIHVLNVSDPSQPKNVSFIRIPGNLDLAIMGDILYADCFVDLVAIDVSDPTNIHVTNWEADVFPNRVWFNSFRANPDSGLIIGWEQELVQDTGLCGNYYYPRGGVMFEGQAVLTAFSSDNTAALSSSGSGQVNSSVTSPGAGVGGSMARFTISNQHLYAIDQVDLHVFDLAKIDDPQFVQDVSIAFNIETIFPYEDNLFIGGQNGVYIYGLSTPSNPNYISEFTHANSCDPVVVQNDVAYVTLRDGNSCGGFTNQLDVIDISDLSNPSLIKSYTMHNPHGLGVDGNNLFICDGDAGLKVFDNQDLNNIDQNHISTVNNGEKYLDIIPLGSDRFAIVMTDEGVCLYDYQNPGNLINLSCLPIILS